MKRSDKGGVTENQDLSSQKKASDQNKGTLGSGGSNSGGNPPARRSDSVVKQALSMAFGTMSSRILGLVRDQAFAALFSKTITDAWWVAFKLPNLFRRLLGEGSLAVSFIPVFVDSRVKDSTNADARNLVNGFYTVLLIVLGTLTTLGIVFAEPIVGLLVDVHFHQIPGKFELTVRMAQIMFSFIFLMSTFAFFMGLLNALGRFALPASAPTLFNIAMIIANFWPSHWQAVQGDALAWGVVIGGVLQTGILIPALIKLGFFPKLTLNLSHPGIKKVWKNMLPGMLGMGLLQLTTVVNIRFAASLGQGTNSLIGYADRLLELPLSLISVSLGTALLPTLAQYWAQNDKEKMIETSSYYLRLNLFIAIPSALGLYFLATPIIEVLFERGMFTPMDTSITAGILQVYAMTLVASSCVRVIVPAYYAIKNTWLPALVSGICLVIHILAAPLFMERAGVYGLVFSTFLSGLANLILLMFAYRFMIGAFHWQALGKSFVRWILPSAALGLVAWGYLQIKVFHWEPLFPNLFLARMLGLFLTVVLASIVFFGLAHLFKVEELHQAGAPVWNKIRRKLKI